VDEVLAECGKRDQRPGVLPARFMVYYVLALALFQQDSYDDVAENLVGRWRGWTRRFRTGPRSPGPGSGWARALIARHRLALPAWLVHALSGATAR
jgi:hypothetical protein